MGAELQTADTTTASQQWPHIARYLPKGRDSAGAAFIRWVCGVDGRLSPDESAACYEEWAAYFEWDLARQTTDHTGDPTRLHLLTRWTDSMAYCCRRSAMQERGDDPGEWVPQYVRRPDYTASASTDLAVLPSSTPSATALPAGSNMP